MQIERVFLLRATDAMDLGLIPRDHEEARQVGWVEVRAMAHSSAAEDLTLRLEDEGIEYMTREERHFSRKELRTARALHLDPANRQVNCKPASTETWDWSEVCQRCMRVPEQVGPVCVAPAEVEGLHIARGKRGEFLVSERIATRMIKESISGCVLREVWYQGENGPEPSPFFQVHPTYELPATFSPPTRFSNNDDLCPVCGLGGLFLDSMLYYDLPVDAIEDFNVTRELFGSGPAVFPELVVSPRFFNLLVSCGAEIEEPEPVVFV